ncbi:hypothetical protein MBH78_14045 [Oceanimonas sp. NS1]|nr:hypothetical protein [Oceanimonas sp. NS1]
MIVTASPLTTEFDTLLAPIHDFLHCATPRHGLPRPESPSDWRCCWWITPTAK